MSAVLATPNVPLCTAAVVIPISPSPKSAPQTKRFSDFAPVHSCSSPDSDYATSPFVKPAEAEEPITQQHHAGQTERTAEVDLGLDNQWHQTDCRTPQTRADTSASARVCARKPQDTSVEQITPVKDLSMEEVQAELQFLQEQAQLTANIVTPADGFLSAADLRVLYTNLEEEQEDDGSESRKRRLEMPAKRLRDARALSPSKDTSREVLPPAHERCINFRNPACEATIRSPVGHRMLGEFRMRGKAQMLSGHLKMLLREDLSGHKKTEQLVKYRYLLLLRKSEQHSMRYRQNAVMKVGIYCLRNSVGLLYAFASGLIYL